MLGILHASVFLKFIRTHPDLRGIGTTSRSNKNMMNIVEKYSAEDAIGDEGVVAIEYVITAGALVVALAALWAAFGTKLTNKLNTIVSGI
jgi:hypothetical protein